jgi:hypothetical protein
MNTQSGSRAHVVDIVEDPPPPRNAVQTARCLAWFDSYIANLDRIGEDPENEPIWHMHEAMPWNSLYLEAVEDWGRDNADNQKYAKLPVPTNSLWQHVRRTRFKNLHRPNHGTFGRCTKCHGLAREVKIATTEDERVQFQATRDFHRAVQRKERDDYNRRVAYAKLNPDCETMMCVDQSKSIFLPRFRPPLAAVTRKHRLELRVGGGLNFSNGNQKYLYVSLASWETTADLVCTQLLEMIVASITSKGSACRSRRLHIHADNSGKENKNQWVIAFCGWLLWLGWFDEAELSFLVVGHTANEDDSVVFSPLHKHAGFATCLSLYDVLKKARQSMSDDTHFIVVDSIWAFRDFFAPQLPGLAGITKARHFRFRLNDSGLPLVQAKEYAALSEVWGEPVQCFVPAEDSPSFPSAYKNTLDPVFFHVEQGLKACLRHTGLDKDTKDFVNHLLAVKSLTADNPTEDTRTPVTFAKGVREDGLPGVAGLVHHSIGTVPIRVVDAQGSAPAIQLSDAVQARRARLGARDSLLAGKFDAALCGPRAGAVDLKVLFARSTQPHALILLHARCLPQRESAMPWRMLRAS